MSLADALSVEWPQVLNSGLEVLHATADSPALCALLLCGVAGGGLLHRRLRGRPAMAEKGPAAMAVRWSHTTLVLLSSFLMFRAPYVWGWAGLVGSQLFFAVSNIICDFCVSDSPRRNLRTIHANGYSNWCLAGSALFVQSLVLTNAILVFTLFPDVQPRVSLELGLTIVLMLAAAEVVFTAMHRHMHMHWPKLHRLHHCCTACSSSTNYVFAPLDVALEFSGPNMIVAAASYALQDAWLFVAAMCIQTMWYGADHEENLAFPHTRHHRYIDHVYTAYVEYRDHSVSDAVKRIVKLTGGINENESNDDAVGEKCAKTE